MLAGVLTEEWMNYKNFAAGLQLLTGVWINDVPLIKIN